MAPVVTGPGDRQHLTIVTVSVTIAGMAESLHPIRAFRLSKNPPISLEVLADQIGTTKANLSRIEAGQNVSTKLLPKVVAATAIPAAKLRPDLAKLFALQPRRRRARAA